MNTQELDAIRQRVAVGSADPFLPPMERHPRGKNPDVPRVHQPPPNPMGGMPPVVMGSRQEVPITEKMQQVGQQVQQQVGYDSEVEDDDSIGDECEELDHIYSNKQFVDKGALEQFPNATGMGLYLSDDSVGPEWNRSRPFDEPANLKLDLSYVVDRHERSVCSTVSGDSVDQAIKCIIDSNNNMGLETGD